MFSISLRAVVVLHLLSVLSYLSLTVAVGEPRPGAGRGRPKVGLVLAGGGALGMAHVGVLRVLEAQRIPVDIIAGTSMGSIVGAAYSSGCSVQEMEQVLLETDWDALFTETLQREDVQYRNKYGRAGQFLGDAKIGIKGGTLARFSGVVSGQNVVPLLQKLYRRTPGRFDFDSLPIPFRAIAADIESGEAVALSSGDLAYAARASMAVPGLFTPVMLDGRALVDGGIANNLPVDVALEMGAERLIVVDLVVDLKKKEELGSMLGIAGQIISLLLQQNSMLQRHNMRPGDLLIVPDLKGFGASDFKKGREILERGESAALAQLATLRQFSVSEEEYAVYRAEREVMAERDGRVITALRVSSDVAPRTAEIERAFSYQVGKQLDAAALKDTIDEVYSEGDLASLAYTVEQEPDGRSVLAITARKPSWYDRYLQIGFSLQDDFQGNSAYQLALGARFNELNRAGGALDLRLDIGWRPLFEIDYYQPLSSGSDLFVNPLLSLDRYQVPVRVEDEEVAEYQRSRVTAGLALGHRLGRSGEAQIGVRRGNGDFKRQVGDPSLREGSYQIGNYFGQISIDSRDTPDFARKGTLFDLEVARNTEVFGSSEDFTQLQGSYQQPFSFGVNTIAFSSDYGVSFQRIDPARVFILGGMFDLAGYQPGGLAASDFVIGRIAYYRELASLGGALAKVNLFGGASFEMAALRSDLPLIDDNTGIVAGMLFVGADTPIVPLYLAAGVNNDDEASLYLNVGRIFRPRR